jgi:hypothetical protein
MMGSATLNVVNVTTSKDGPPVFWIMIAIMNATHCYHPDCGGKPIQFCPYRGNHPS